MRKADKVLHGSCSSVYINGELDELASKIEVKMTGDFAEQSFCGDYATHYIYNGFSISGSMSDMKKDSALELAIVKGYQTGIMPDVTLITVLKNPTTGKSERWSLGGVVFTEVALANIEAKNAVARDLPFNCERATCLESIN